MPIDKLNLKCYCNFSEEYKERIKDKKNYMNYPVTKEGHFFSKYDFIQPIHFKEYHIKIVPWLDYIFFSCNPNRLGLDHLKFLLNSIFDNPSLCDFKITRIDFNVDLEIPVKKIRDSVYIKRKRIVKPYREDFILSPPTNNYNLTIGKPPETLTIYDKLKERYYRQSQYQPNMILDINENDFNKVTRLEMKLSGNKLPIEDLSEIEKLKDLDPWEHLLFYEVEDKLFDRCRELKRYVHRFGMQMAFKIMSKKYKSKESWKKFLIERPDLSLLVQKSYFYSLGQFFKGIPMNPIETMHLQFNEKEVGMLTLNRKMLDEEILKIKKHEMWTAIEYFIDCNVFCGRGLEHFDDFWLRSFNNIEHFWLMVSRQPDVKFWIGVIDFIFGDEWRFENKSTRISHITDAAMNYIPKDKDSVDYQYQCAQITHDCYKRLGISLGDPDPNFDEFFCENGLPTRDTMNRYYIWDQNSFGIRILNKLLSDKKWNEGIDPRDSWRDVLEALIAA